MIEGASFFGPLHEAVGGGYPAETVNALWALAWKGLVTNDTFQVVRAFTQSSARVPPHSPASRSHAVPVAATGAGIGRRTLDAGAGGEMASEPKSRSASERSRTAWATALVQQLLTRYGVLTREAVMSESIAGGFGACYPVLKAMEEAGRLRRGYFIAGLGATQFALPGALDLLRSLEGNAAKSRKSWRWPRPIPPTRMARR